MPPRDNFIRGGVFHRRRAGKGQVELPVADQFPVADGLPTARSSDHSLGHGEGGQRRCKSLRGHLQQGLTGLCGRLLRLGSADPHRRAGIGAALIGGHLGLQTHRPDLLHGEIQFLRRHL